MFADDGADVAGAAGADGWQVPGAGFEPARPFEQSLLRGSSLPFLHPGEWTSRVELRQAVAGRAGPEPPP